MDLGKKFLRVTTTQKTSLFQRLIPEFQGNFSALWWRNPFRETLLFLGATIWDLGHIQHNFCLCGIAVSWFSVVPNFGHMRHLAEAYPCDNR